MSVITHNFIRDDNSGAIVNADLNMLQKYRSLRANKINDKKRLDDIEANLKLVRADISIINTTLRELASSRK